jgi:DNA-binding NarL/FixJ family response regulator
MERFGKRKLTAKEQVIIKLVADGLRNVDIASRIGQTCHGMKNNLRVIFDKLGVWSRLELALWFLKSKKGH